MSDIVFYTNPMSRGQIVSWMLEELGEPYDTEWIEYGGQMKGPDYLAINPMGKVPAIRHKGSVVTECGAICTYLAASYPGKGLIPAAGDPTLADFYRWMFFTAGPLEQAVTVRSMGWESSEERSSTLGFGNQEDTMNAVETALAKGLFICGEQFTAVDVYLGSALSWGMQFDTIDKRPAFEEYAQRLTQRPAAQRSHEINEERMQQTSGAAPSLRLVSVPDD
jgi:glutathione S-transferase